MNYYELGSRRRGKREKGKEDNVNMNVCNRFVCRMHAPMYVCFQGEKESGYLVAIIHVDPVPLKWLSSMVV